MKKKSASQSAPARRSLGEGGFFNLRVLVGLFVGMTGISLALFGANPFGRANNPSASGAAKAQPKYNVTTGSSIDPLVPAMFDCSKIKQLGIDRQENLRAGAIMIHCGMFEGRKVFFWRQSVLEGCAKPDGTPGVWRNGREPDHRHRELSERDPIRDVHYGKPR